MFQGFVRYILKLEIFLKLQKNFGTFCCAGRNRAIILGSIIVNDAILKQLYIKSNLLLILY